MTIDWNGILAWIKSNEIILGLLLSAIVITMPEALPHWKEFPQWMWSWVRDALKTFMNFRHSGAPVTDTQHAQEKMTTQQDVNKKLPVVNGPQQLNG